MNIKKHSPLSMIPFQNVKKEGITYSEIDYTLNIVRDGKENDFTEYLAKTVSKSPTAAACLNRLSEFIIGRELHPDIKDVVINSDGDTMQDLHNKVALDLAYYDRIAIKILPNKSGGIDQVYHTPAEWVRFAANENVLDPFYHFAKVNPYLNTLQEHWGTEQVETLRLYENQKNVRKEVLEGGEKYKGHILFYNETRPGFRIYSRPLWFISLERTIITDRRIWEFHDRNTANNFFLGFIMSIVGDPDEGYGDQNDEGKYYQTFKEVFEKELWGQFAGSENAGTGMVFYKRNSTDPDPNIVPFPTGTTDRMFTELINDTVQTISATMGIPAILFPRETAGALGQSNKMREAIAFVNEKTAQKRKLLEKKYKIILEGKGIKYPQDEQLIIPLQDFSDLPDAIFNALTPSQKAKYLQENFGVEEDTEGKTEMEESKEDEELGLIKELITTQNGNANN